MMTHSETDTLPYDDVEVDVDPSTDGAYMIWCVCCKTEHMNDDYCATETCQHFSYDTGPDGTLYCENCGGDGADLR